MKGVRMLVTGAGSGIGQAVAAEALARGARVAALDVDPSRAPDGAVRLAADVTDDEAVVRAVDEAAAAMSGIDVVINNAGIGAQGTVEANPIDEWQRVFDVNVFGMVRVSRAALPYLRRSDCAAIVNTCSIAATAGLPERALYSATKGAVLSLTLAMAADHLREGIRVNCVNPGTADTPWIGRLLEKAADPVSRARGARGAPTLGTTCLCRGGGRRDPLPRVAGGQRDDRDRPRCRWGDAGACASARRSSGDHMPAFVRDWPCHGENNG